MVQHVGMTDALKCAGTVRWSPGVSRLPPPAMASAKRLRSRAVDTKSRVSMYAG